MAETADAPGPGTYGAGAAARDEAARQAVMVAGGLVLIAAAAVVERWASSPDSVALARARVLLAGRRAAKHTERAAAVTAGRCWQLAEAARRHAESGPR